jgi:hypothetical protein
MRNKFVYFSLWVFRSLYSAPSAVDAIRTMLLFLSFCSSQELILKSNGEVEWDYTRDKNKFLVNILLQHDQLVHSVCVQTMKDDISDLCRAAGVKVYWKDSVEEDGVHKYIFIDFESVHERLTKLMDKFNRSYDADPWNPAYKAVYQGWYTRFRVNYSGDDSTFRCSNLLYSSQWVLYMMKEVFRFWVMIVESLLIRRRRVSSPCEISFNIQQNNHMKGKKFSNWIDYIEYCAVLLDNSASSATNTLTRTTRDKRGTEEGIRRPNIKRKRQELKAAESTLGAMSDAMRNEMILEKAVDTWQRKGLHLSKEQKILNVMLLAFQEAKQMPMNRLIEFLHEESRRDNFCLQGLKGKSTAISQGTGSVTNKESVQWLLKYLGYVEEGITESSVVEK